MKKEKTRIDRKGKTMMTMTRNPWKNKKKPE
jgi:hypothetical protein